MLFFDDSAVDRPSWVGYVHDSWEILGDEIKSNT